MRKILVATKGVNGALVRVLEFLFNNSQYYNFVITGKDDENIAIFQFESAADVHQLEAYQEKYPARSTVVVCKEDVKLENTVLLKFPVSPNRLMQALCQTAGAMSSTSTKPEVVGDVRAIKKTQPQAKSINRQESPKIDIPSDDNKVILTLPDVDLDDADFAKKISYSEEKFLQGRLQTAVRVGKEKNSNIQIYSPHGVFRYYPTNHKFLVELGAPSLRNLASVPDAIASDMTFFDINSGLEESDRKKQICADELLWSAAIWASRGRLICGVDLDRKFYLKSWPNFTRWMSLPNDMQLTVAWLNQPTTLREFVQFSDIPQRYIFTFFSAVHAVDLIKFDRQTSAQAQPVRKSKRAEGSKNFISRIIEYIKADAVADA